MILNHGWWNEALLRVTPIHRPIDRLLLLRRRLLRCYNSRLLGLQQLVLLLLTHNNVPFRLISDINTSNLVALALIDILESKQRFLTHE